MARVTRTQKHEALVLLKSRHITDALAFQLVGWMSSISRDEIDLASKPGSVSLAIYDFVQAFRADIEACPLRDS